MNLSGSPSSEPESATSSDGVSQQVDAPGAYTGVSPRTRDIIALVITGVWGVSLIGELVVPSFEPSPYLLATELGLAAAIFGSGFWKGVR